MRITLMNELEYILNKLNFYLCSELRKNEVYAFDALELENKYKLKMLRYFDTVVVVTDEKNQIAGGVFICPDDLYVITRPGPQHDFLVQGLFSGDALRDKLFIGQAAKVHLSQVDKFDDLEKQLIRLKLVGLKPTNVDQIICHLRQFYEFSELMIDQFLEEKELFDV